MFPAGFFFLHSIYYYATQALMGIGFAMYYAGQGFYMSEHSTKSTISRNSALVSAIGNCSMLNGGIIMALIFYLRRKSDNLIDVVKDVEGPSYRDFSNKEIYLIHGVLLVFSFTSNIIFASLPTKRISDREQFENVDKATFRTQLSNILDCAKERRLVLLAAFFAFYGLHVSYFLGAYPTTFAFTKILSTNVYLPAYYSFMLGVGNVIAGGYIAFFNTRFSNFGLIPSMATEVVLSIAMYLLTFATTANLSTIQTTDDTSTWITPSVATCCMLGLLNGMINCCSCTMRALICTIAIPRKRLQAYSLAKLYQSAASCAAYFLSPQLTVRAWIFVMAGIQLFSATGFVLVSKQILRDEVKNKLQPKHVINKIKPSA
ncbi:unnamed protein product [Cylicocyclus nassatus]|uniref:UNC93-like protein MFSD11 n=1 Tax=Cylicocyclus nassatus TaxID=53992 RepID=A0AA36DSG4_CYLNA|nr:unnamed protein product [Cylicocyclus nassatus]